MLPDHLRQKRWQANGSTVASFSRAGDKLAPDFGERLDNVQTAPRRHPIALGEPDDRRAPGLDQRVLNPPAYNPGCAKACAGMGLHERHLAPYAVWSRTSAGRTRWPG